MIGFIKRLWAASPIATTLLALALVVAGVFGARMVIWSVYWSEPARHEQALAGWMTPGYVAHSWRVPREVVLDALDAPMPPPGGPMNIHELADYHNTSVEALIAEATAAIEAFRASHPEGGPKPKPAPPPARQPGEAAQ